MAAAGDRRFDAVVFDFSGVMVSSAFTAIGAAAADHDMDEDEFLEYLLGPYAEDTDHAWHKAERGEIGIYDWITDTMSRAESDGLGLDLGFMASMLGELEVYDVMVDCARTLRGQGYKTSLLTNNIAEGRDSWRPMLPLDELFDDVVDSSEVGMRKPNPMIYRLALDRLGCVEPSRAVMLDDHPGNCGGARGVGMEAILVEDPAVAVDELMDLLAS
ncbi:MAG: HAD family phosphatase [Acidimicrobiales bacterium]|nr:HAD family phosphatase [Acidimicrobiales bacterium]